MEGERGGGRAAASVQAVIASHHRGSADASPATVKATLSLCSDYTGYTGYTGSYRATPEQFYLQAATNTDINYHTATIIIIINHYHHHSHHHSQMPEIEKLRCLGFSVENHSLVREREREERENIRQFSKIEKSCKVVDKLVTGLKLPRSERCEH